MTAVSLVPAASRPYADGSHDNSVYEQVFVYNGFGRFGDQTPRQLVAAEFRGVSIPLITSAPSPGRLLSGDLGRDTGWLLPAAAAVAVWGIVSRRRQPRGDPLRACLVLWGGWLATLAAVFSAITTINAYYAAALTPAVAALLGAGVAASWTPGRTAAGRRIGLAAVVAGTAAYAAWLVPASGTRVPGWLVPAVIAVGVVAAGTALASLVIRRDALFAAALAAGLIAVSLVPGVASAGLAAGHEGAFDTPFESAREADYSRETQAITGRLQTTTIPRLEALQNGAPYLMATQTALLASLFIYASGREVLPIGGFTGTIPAPTLSQLQADVRDGRFHLVLAFTSSDPRLVWIATHCRAAGRATAALHSYYCLPADAG
jgi:hypothetical protein